MLARKTEAFSAKQPGSLGALRDPGIVRIRRTSNEWCLESRVVSETSIASIPSKFRRSPALAQSALRGGTRSAEIEARFVELRDRWLSETSHFSSIADAATHPAYQQIIGMGALALPLILAELHRAPGHWFWALVAISGDDPVRDEDRGKIPRMAEAWLSWGLATKLLS